MIGQRDNRLNIEIGNASKKVAEASSRDSAAMKAIAEDSKKIALAAKRDSTAMKTISVLTLRAGSCPSHSVPVPSDEMGLDLNSCMGLD